MHAQPFCPVWLCNSLGCSPPGSSVHGISQARILEWVAISFSIGVFPNQDSILCLLHWQADSLSPSHPGSPRWTLSRQSCRDFFHGREITCPWRLWLGFLILNAVPGLYSLLTFSGMCVIKEVKMPLRGQGKAREQAHLALTLQKLFLIIHCALG